ncbi:MAG: hypothetical protein LQ341_007574 [Variospora aurantia]|nr:MAG: hypothetical protein LQ341_007574 [Variospora aurantia]
MSTAKLVAPLRPERPQGLTLSASVLGVQKTTGGSSSPKPAFPEKSRFRAQVGLESPVSPMTRASPVMAFGSPKARDRRSQLSRASSERSSRTTGTARGQRPSPGPSKMRERQMSGSSSSSSSSSRSKYCRRRQRIATPLRRSQTTKTVHGPGSSAIAPESKEAKDLAAASSSSPRNRRCEPPPDSQLRRSQTTNTACAPRQSANPRKSDLNVSIPAPLNLKRSGSNDTNPFADPKRARSTKASATTFIAKNNPFFSHEERKWNLPSPTSDTDEDDGEGIVAPSVIPGGEYSDSAYSDDTDTEQRFLEEHDTLMKLVGRGQLRTRDYLNTLPERMESRD